MSSMTKIETAIQKLSLAEQKIIALHLGERLVNEASPAGDAGANEGIPFLSEHDAPSEREVLPGHQRDPHGKVAR